MSWIQAGLFTVMTWCLLNTLHFVVRPLRLRREWKRSHRGVGK